MIYYIIVGQVFLQIITLVIIFSKSYATKKGENLATKEDIGEITNIVESIKTDLNANTEKLKSELALKNEHIISLRSLERDSLIGYYKELYSLLNYFTRLDPTIYNLDNFNDIDKIKMDIDNEFHKYNLAEAYVELFFDNQNFIEKKHDLNILVKKMALSMTINLIKYKQLYSLASIDINYQKTPLVNIHKQLGNDVIEHLKNYYKERNETYNEIDILALKIKKDIKVRLLEIVNI